MRFLRFSRGLWPLVWLASMSLAAAQSPRLEAAQRRMDEGHAAEALALLEEDRRDNGLTSHNAWDLLRLQADQGRHHEALQTLETMLRVGRAVPAAWLEAEARLAPLREDPRWQALVARAHQRDALERRLQGAAALETGYRASLPLVERLAGVSRLWMEAKNHFANFDLVPDLDWDALYLRTLERVQKTPDTLTYYGELMRMVAALNDGHSNVYPPEALWEALWARPALRTARIEDRVVITAVLDPALAKQGVRVGQQVLRVDGLAVETHVARRVLPTLSASTPQDRKHRAYGQSLLAGNLSQAVRLQLGDGTRTRQVRIPRVSVARAWELEERPAFAWRKLPGDIALVELNSFADDSAADAFMAAFDEIAQSRAIVFDVRHNGGGNSQVGYRILATLSDRPIASSRWWTRTQVSAWRAWGRAMPLEGGHHGDVLPDPKRHYRGALALLVGPGTYSAAEDFTAAFRSLGRGPVLGAATGGSTGQPLFFKLPGGGQARLCVKRDLLADGQEFVGRGIAPDLPVATTWSGWLAGRDEVLDAAVQALQEVAKP